MSATAEAPTIDLPEFISRWAASAASERANYQLFLSELCDYLGVPRPNPSVNDVSKNIYAFERDVKFQNTDGSTSDGRIDLYKRGCFVLEAKQGTEAQNGDGEPVLSSTPKRLKRGHGVRGSKGWDDAMVKARGQAELYAKALPVDEGWPPFLIVVDVGHSIELYADFTRSGKTYLQHPDPKSFRILLPDLVKDDVRELLRSVWTDPQSLDPTRRAAKVTRELADRLAKLAKSLEKSKFEPGRVAQFLMRCLFTMFAEDVDLIPRESFSQLLKSIRDDVATFPDMVRSLWESMDKGQFHPVLRKKLRRFNGGLFEDCEALPLTTDQLDLLIEASQALWRDVEPAIFGTLLERALDPTERHKLGAHYTPRAYVERLVMPTIIEPLREDWDAVRAAALVQAKRGDKEDAAQTIRNFHQNLCVIRVLDPACGTGNFLYVAMEHMKRIEGEALNLLHDLGDTRFTTVRVDPHQFLGIEINPRAAAIADLVLWIGFLQWQLRTHHLREITEPIIEKYHNIDCRDAVLDWDRVEEVKDDQGKPVTRWDGRTMKKHPVTGEDVPDDTARVPVLKYINPQKADWPEAEFIVGNPPFIGKLFVTHLLGEGYVDALRTAYDEDVPDGADYVLYWWQQAARRVAAETSKRFGLITTNSIRQWFSRRVVGTVLREGKVYLRFVIPDHPWVDEADGAAVRIAMTVGAAGHAPGNLLTIKSETETGDGASLVDFSELWGSINADLTIGADVSSAVPLKSNRIIASMGPALGSRGFVVDADKRQELVSADGPIAEKVIRPLRNGSDLIDGPRGVFAIDLTGLDEDAVRRDYPAIWQHLYDNVRPERIHNRDLRLQRVWWQFRRSNELFRSMLKGMKRFIVTVETAKYRLFFLCDDEILAEHGTISFGLSDTYFLGVLSSRLHVRWALSSGGTLEDRPRYNKTLCFEPFPFPIATEKQQVRIRSLGEQLDAHRKKQQALHPDLTLTGMYNVLEKLRSGEPLTAKEKTIHEQGLVSVLKQIHDDLDAAVFDAYGWPVTLTDEEILERLVTLNAERAAEEARGVIRWLRPEFQNPAGGKSIQKTMQVETEEEEEVPATGKKPKTAKSQAKLPWPKKLSDQAQAVAQQLQAATKPVTPAELAKSFTRANVDQLAELLETLVSLGKAREVKAGRFSAA